MSCGTRPESEAERFMHHGVQVHIMYDPYFEDPRKEWDHLAHMICFEHPRYILGDPHDSRIEDCRGEVMAAELRRQYGEEVYMMLPLYLYDHSGITMRIGQFSDRWDSRQIGFIYVTREEVKREYSVKQRISAKVRARVQSMLEAEVHEYDQFLTGEVYGYVLTDGAGHELDSCWGFYGTDYARECAREAADCLVDQF